MNSITPHAAMKMPSTVEMYQALCNRDSNFEGLFFVGVRTTGIFCRPTCPARKPNRKNVDFYRSVQDALAAGFRPCKKCRPLEVFGAAPDWLDGLLQKVEYDPTQRWTDSDLRALDVEPTRVRRWFKQNHGMTFHAYLRSRRLAAAMGQIQVGRPTTGAALDCGFQSLSGFRDAFKKWSGDAPSNVKNGNKPIIVNRILSPLGPMVAAVTSERLCLLEFADRPMLETQLKRIQRIYRAPLAPGENDIIQQTEIELQEYFESVRRDFNVPLDVQGTEFQLAVWNQLQQIPFGETTSYDQMARRIGRPGAQRAVGRANGDNRLAIVIPCHRVLRSDGSLSGYGGGVWRKQWLLDHEQQLLF
jgi:AraC family transcriptional regulator of adaptative response/methylated-DNA-[protein]-cysteine methyltransferase